MLLLIFDLNQGFGSVTILLADPNHLDAYAPINSIKYKLSK